MVKHIIEGKTLESMDSIRLLPEDKQFTVRIWCNNADKYRK